MTDPQPAIEHADASGDQPSNLPSRMETTHGDQPAISTNQDGAVNLDGMTMDQLEDLLAGNLPVEDKSPQSPEKKDEQQDLKPAKNDDDDDPQTQANDDGTKQPRVRINLNQLPKSEQDLIRKARDMVANGEAKSVKDAILKLDSDASPATTQEAPTESTNAETQSGAPAAVKAIEDRIAVLKAKREDARNKDFDNAEADRLSDEIADAIADLKLAKIDAGRQQQEAQTWAQQEQKNLDSVVIDFPDLLDESSDFYDEFLQQRTVAEATNSEIMKSPDWAIKIAKNVSDKLSRLRGSGSIAKPQATKDLPPTPTKPARPIGQLSPGTADRPTYTQQELDQALAKLSRDKLEDVLASSNPAAALGLV